MEKVNLNGVKGLTPNEQKFVIVMLENGYSLNETLALLGKTNSSETAKPTTVVNTTVNKSNTTKSGKGKNKPASEGSNKTTTNKVGNIKEGDYFKVVVNDKVTFVGKAKKVRKNDKVVETVGGKKFVLENCIAISKKQYQSLKKTLKAEKGEKVSTSKRLTPTDYKIVYCRYLLQIGKINEETFAKAKDSAEIRSELYKQFKADVKLDNAEALKLFAADSAKAEETANA